MRSIKCIILFFYKAVNLILLEKNIGEGHLALVSNGLLDMKSKDNSIDRSDLTPSKCEPFIIYRFLLVKWKVSAEWDMC